MRRLLLWLCSRYNIVTVKEKTRYVVNWFPKPNAADMVSMLTGHAFTMFMEHCQRKAALTVAIQTTKDGRADCALVMEGVYAVERWAKDYLGEFKKEEPVIDESMSLEPDVLLREYDELRQQQTNGL